MEKREIELKQLKDALIDTFRHYSWDTTDYDVWVGIYEYFAVTLWRLLCGENVADEREPNDLKHPQMCRHEKQWHVRESEIGKMYRRLFGRLYWRTRRRKC